MNTKSSFVAVVGNTNVGKSTLVNNLVGIKVSIVTHKVQTTRSKIKAILTKEDTQLVFIDTPGIFIPKKDLEREIIKNAWEGFSGVDAIMVVVDARFKVDQPFLDIVKKLHGKVALVINKIDLVERGKLLPLTEELNNIYKFDATFMISALKNSGVDDLRKYLLSCAKESVWHYDKDDETDMPVRFNLAEITREKLFMRFHQEVPYSLTVETESVEKQEKKVVIHQIIYVGRDAHKKMVIGSEGAAIKKVRLLATDDMEDMLNTRVNLFLFVKVRKNWENRHSIMKTISY